MKRKLFIKGENPEERAYIGWQDESLSLQGLKMGYKNSANELVNIALEQGKKGRIDILDTYIFPILFLYRHSIEISLKHIYFRVYNELPDGGHDLLTIWGMINNKIFKYLSDADNIRNLNKIMGTNKQIFFISESEKNKIKDILKELQGQDYHNEIWRYLLKRDGNLYFNEWRDIDYNNLRDTFNWLYDELDGLYCYIDSILSV